MNALDAAFNLVNDYPGGAAALAVRMGKSGSSLAHELRGAGTAKLGLLDAVKISALSGDSRIVAAMAASCGGIFIPLAHDAAGDPMHQMAALMQRMAGLQTAFQMALADGKVSSNELRDIERTAQDLIGAVNSITSHSRGVHEETCARMADAGVLRAV